MKRKDDVATKTPNTTRINNKARSINFEPPKTTCQAKPKSPISDSLKGFLKRSGLENLSSYTEEDELSLISNGSVRLLDRSARLSGKNLVIGVLAFKQIRDGILFSLDTLSRLTSPCSGSWIQFVFTGLTRKKLGSESVRRMRYPAVLLEGPPEGFLFRVKVLQGGATGMSLKIRTALPVRSAVP